MRNESGPFVQGPFRTVPSHSRPVVLRVPLSWQLKTRSKPDPIPTLRGWRDLLVACSLANLCLLKIWSLLMQMDVSSPAQPNAFVAAFLILAVLSAAIWAALRLFRRHAGGPPLALRCLLTFPFLVALHGLLTVLFLNTIHTRIRDVAYLAAAAMAVAVLAGRANAIRLFKVLLAVSPFLPLMLVESGWAMWKVRPPAPLPPTQPRLAMKASVPRVVWMLFDTWDYGLSFPDRDPSLRLPEMDRLRNEALFSENAFPPGPETIRSVPELLGNTESTLGATPNVLSGVHDRGFNVGVVGWFFPYCEQYRGALASCAEWERACDRNSWGTGVFEILRSQARIMVEAEFRSPLGQLLSTRGHARVVEQWVPAAEKAVSDPGLSLVYLHAPIPHEPFFYNRFSGRNDLGATFLGGLAGLRIPRFLDALELADHTIGKLRRAMEQSGTWDASAVIATADHSYRTRDRVDGRPRNMRVPFIVKLPGQHEGLPYTGHVETVHTGDLIQAILNGEVKRSEDLVRWLDAHRTS